MTNLIQLQPGTIEANTAHDLHDVVKESNVVHRLRKFNVTKVARTRRHVPHAGLAQQPSIQRSEAEVEQARRLWDPIDVRLRSINFSDRHVLDLRRRQEAKLDAADLADLLHMRRRGGQSRLHLVQLTLAGG